MSHAEKQYLKNLAYFRQYSKKKYAQNKQVILDKALFKRTKFYRDFPIEMNVEMIKQRKALNLEIKKGFKLKKIELQKSKKNIIHKKGDLQLKVERIIKQFLNKKIFATRFRLAREIRKKIERTKCIRVKRYVKIKRVRKPKKKSIRKRRTKKEMTESKK